MAGMEKIKAEARALWYGLPAADLEESGSAAVAPATPRLSRRFWLIAAAVLVALVAVFVVVRVQDVRAQDRQTDVYYCTMDGVGLFDRGPNTGKLCADLLTE